MLNLYMVMYLTEIVAFRNVYLFTSSLGSGAIFTPFMFSNFISQHSTNKMHNIFLRYLYRNVALNIPTYFYP
jgi:hypothetical protein